MGFLYNPGMYGVRSQRISLKVQDKYYARGGSWRVGSVLLVETLCSIRHTFGK